MITHIYSIWIVVLLVTNYLMKRFLDLKMTKKIDQKLLKKTMELIQIYLHFFLFFPQIFSLLYPDPDTEGKKNVDLCGSGCKAIIVVVVIVIVIVVKVS